MLTFFPLYGFAGFLRGIAVKYATILVKFWASDQCLVYKYKENFVILQSMGIIVIKSRETRAVIYTCRYFSGQFNTWFSALAEF